MPASKIITFLVLCAVIAAVCGYLGFRWEEPPSTVIYDAKWKIFDDLYQTAQLFVISGSKFALESKYTPSTSHVLINIARFLAPVSLAGAILSAAVSFWAPQLNRMRGRIARSHVIVTGGGDMANLYFRHFCSKNLITISISETRAEVDAIRTKICKRGLVFRGTSIDVDQWYSISSQRAKTILLANNDDQKNLAGAKSLANLNWGNHSKRPKLFCHIRNTALRDELVSQIGLFSNSSTVRLEPFSISELAARNFFQKRDFFWDAKIRNHKRVHWLMIGTSEFCFTFLRHFLAISPSPDFEIPLVTVVHDASQEHLRPYKFLSKQCGSFFQYEHLELAEFEEKLNDANGSVNCDTPVTAFLVNSDDKSAVELALALRRASFRDPLLKAPIFFAGDDIGMWNVGKFGKLSHYLHDEVSPLADTAELCTSEVLTGSQDRAAMAYHHNYLASIPVRDPTKTPSHRPWDQLDENFRRSNRRAADHAKTKCEYLGVLGTQNSKALAAQIPMNELDQSLEVLAESEHNSWMTDRLIHGWKHAEKRDDYRWLHPDLVHYLALDNSTKEKDREQVRELFRPSLNVGNTAVRYRTVKVGLIGRNLISTKEANNIYVALIERILPQLCEDYSNHELRFFTPLSPGSELVSAQSAQAFFAKKKEPHKIYIIESNDPSSRVEAFQSDRRPNNCWGLKPDNQPSTSGLTTDILGCMHEFARSHQTVNVVVKRDQNFLQLLEASTDYFCSKMDVLIAYQGDRPSNGKFGTAGTVQRATANGLDIRMI